MEVKMKQVCEIFDIPRSTIASGNACQVLEGVYQSELMMTLDLGYLPSIVGTSSCRTL